MTFGRNLAALSLTIFPSIASACLACPDRLELTKNEILCLQKSINSHIAATGIGPLLVNLGACTEIAVDDDDPFKGDTRADCADLIDNCPAATRNSSVFLDRGQITCLKQLLTEPRIALAGAAITFEPCHAEPRKQPEKSAD